VTARRRHQHARRVRSPELCATRWRPRGCKDKRIRKPENQERLTNQALTQLGHLGHLILVLWFPNLIKVRAGEAPSPAREARALPGTLRYALATARLQDKRIRKPENQERLTNQTVTQLGHLGHLILVSWFPNLIQVRAGEAPSLRQLPDEGVLPGTITAPPTRKKARLRFRCRPTDSGGADFRRRRAGYRRDSRSAVRSPGCR
jgi:hypothetical protein